VVYREAHTLIEEIAHVTIDGTRKALLADLATVPLLIIDDLGMRKVPRTAAEDVLELITRRDERGSTLLTSNRPVDDWQAPRRHGGHHRAPQPTGAPRRPRSKALLSRSRPWWPFFEVSISGRI
jgi:hypothetical protein